MPFGINSSRYKNVSVVAILVYDVVELIKYITLTEVNVLINKLRITI